MEDCHEEAVLLADLRLQYEHFVGLDGGVEVHLRMVDSSDRCYAVPLLQYAAVLEQPPRKSLCLGGKCIMVPKASCVVEGGERVPMEMVSGSWWTGMSYSFFMATRTAPPGKALFEAGLVRAFVLPIDGETNQRRVVVACSRDALCATCSPPPERLLVVAAAAASKPPIGEWLDASSASAIGQLIGYGVRAEGPADSWALFPHQQRSVEWMRAVEAEGAQVEPLPYLQLPGAPLAHEARVQVTLPAGGVLGHPVGSGKTRIALAFVGFAAAADRAALGIGSEQPTSLVLCPAHLVPMWDEEAMKLGALVATAVDVRPFEGLHELSQAPAGRWARLVVDEPQELPSGAAVHLRECHLRRDFPIRWVLCGTAKEQLRQCTTIVYGGELPHWVAATADGSSTAARNEWGMAWPHHSLVGTGLWERLAAGFVRRRCVADAPGHCLPPPPSVERLVPISLPLGAAMLVQAHMRGGELANAVYICNGCDEPIPAGARPAHAMDDFERLVGRGWKDSLQQRARPQRDARRAEADAAHAARVAALGLRCTCDQSGASYWHCEGAADEAAAGAGGDSSDASCAYASSATRLAIHRSDDTQGVDDELRDRFGKAQAEVERLERLLRWMAASRSILLEESASCGVCLEPMWHSTVAMYPCLHLVCDSCERKWRHARTQGAREEASSAATVPCPHCRSVARLGQIVIFSARGGTDGGGTDGGATPASAPEAGGKLQALTRLLREVLDGGPDERAVIFGQWSGVLRATLGALQAAGIACLTLCGVPLEARIDALRRFGREGEPRVLLLSSDAHASGVNLQCARHVVLLHPHCPDIGSIEALRRRSLAEATAYDVQAIGRVRRYPQTREVTVHRLFVRGSVEEELIASQGLLRQLAGSQSEID